MPSWVVETRQQDWRESVSTHIYFHIEKEDMSSMTCIYNFTTSQTADSVRGATKMPEFGQGRVRPHLMIKHIYGLTSSSFQLFEHIN